MHEHGGKQRCPAANRIGNARVKRGTEQARGHHAVAEYRCLLCGTQRYLPVKDTQAQSEDNIGNPWPMARGIVVANGQEKHATRRCLARYSYL